MDEKRDLIVCNEYLKTAIEICELIIKKFSNYQLINY